jgi:hypothetical protein
MVLAHGGVRETVERHLPVWKQNHDRVIICSPADDPLGIPGEWGFVNGKSSRYAADTNERTRQALALASEMRPHFLTFCEYDALLWHWPESDVHMMGPDGVMGSRFESADPKFKGKFYMHSPILFGPLAIEKVCKEMFKLPRDAEYGFGDRYFGLAIERAGIPVVNGHDHGLSYSQNHIEKQHWMDAGTKIEQGAVFTHGVKDEKTFRILCAAAKITY